MYFGIFYGKVN